MHVEIFTMSMFRRLSINNCTILKEAILSVTLLVIFSGCDFSDNNLLTNRWSFDYANAPIIKTLADSAKIFNILAPYKQVFVSSKLILRKDKSFDCVLFDNYQHGNFQFDEENQQLFLTPCNQKETIRLTIDSNTTNLLQFRIDSINFAKWKDFRNPPNSKDRWFTHNRQVIFRMTADKEVYSNPGMDPYNIQNNSWRIKPIKSESEEEVKQRIKKHLLFYKLLFDDAYTKDAEFIAFNWFVSPILPANNGIALKNYNKIKRGWEDYFYNSSQAIEGFELLRDAFGRPLEFPDKIENKFKRGSIMMGQLLQNIE